MSVFNLTLDEYEVQHVIVALARVKRTEDMRPLSIKILQQATRSTLEEAEEFVNLVWDVNESIDKALNEAIDIT